MRCVSFVVAAMATAAVVVPTNAISAAQAGCTMLGENSEVLDCSAKQTQGSLTSVPTDIPKEVVHLWLSGNQISRINAVDFAGLNSLKYLYLDGNLITSIEAGSFDSLHSLLFLLLNHNAITVIPDGTLGPMVNLEALDLRGNAINSVNAQTFAGLSNLVYLNLFGNSVGSIGCGTFNAVPSLGYLNLIENPSQCGVDDHSTGVLTCACSAGMFTGASGFCSTTETCDAEQPVLSGFLTGAFRSTTLPPSATDALVPLNDDRFTTIPTTTVATSSTSAAVGADANAGAAAAAAGDATDTGMMLAGLIGGMAVMVVAVGVAINARAHSQGLMGNGQRYMLASSHSTSAPPTMTSYDSHMIGRAVRGDIAPAADTASNADLMWDDGTAGPVLTWNAGADAGRRDSGGSEGTASLHTSIMNRNMDEEKWRGSMWNAGGRAMRGEPISKSTLSHYSSSATLPR